MSLSTEHLVLLGTPGRLQFWNMTALEDNRFLVDSRLILLKSLAVNLRLFFLNTFLATLLTICNKTLDGSVITPQYLSNFKSAASLSNTFLQFLTFQSQNNYAHLDKGR